MRTLAFARPCDQRKVLSGQRRCFPACGRTELRPTRTTRRHRTPDRLPERCPRLAAPRVLERRSAVCLLVPGHAGVERGGGLRAHWWDVVIASGVTGRCGQQVQVGLVFGPHHGPTRQPCWVGGGGGRDAVVAGIAAGHQFGSSPDRHLPHLPVHRPPAQIRPAQIPPDAADGPWPWPGRQRGDAAGQAGPAQPGPAVPSFSNR
jgi:hypothetical protein